MNRDIDPDRLVVLGRVTGVFGLDGWVRARSYTEPESAMLDYENVLLGKSGVWRTESVETGRATARGVQFKLLGVDDRDSASLLVGADVAVPRSALPPVEPGRYYLHDLEGLEVVTPTGELLGDVTHFLQSPAHPVMVVRREQKEHLIPVVAERLLAVDLQQGRITVDWQADW